MKKTLERQPGARVDTSQPVDFQFDGKRYQGFAGDSLASALLANGVAVVGRSFKLHRPRGVVGAGEEEPNALVQLESAALTEPNARATGIFLYEGLEARGQNAWPRVGFDLFGLLSLLKRFLPAGFYYKTFMWPSWHTWEWLVRRLAGLGKAPTEADPQTYIKQNVHAEVVVVGAGRSGLLAALEAAADPRCRVLLMDQQEEPGGALLASSDVEDRRWLADAAEKIAASENITLFQRTTVNGYYDNNVLVATEKLTNHLSQSASEGPRERLWRIFAGRVVLATGAIERPLVFPDNDRPGIMLASAVREFSHRYGLTLGDRVVFYTNNDSAWRTALELADSGVGVAAVVDIRASVDPALVQRAEQLGIARHLGTAVTATRGRKAVRKLVLRQLAGEGDALGAAAGSLDCDLLAMSGGWTPTVHLYSQSGGRLDYRTDDACFVPATAHQAVTVVGRARGEFKQPLNLKPQWLTPGVSPDHQWVDFQYDVTVADIQLAQRENFSSVELVKRYTTSGMSVDQGKTSNVNALGVLAQASGRPIPEVGTTRFRPPYSPATLGAYGGVELGKLYHPYQLLPAHEAHTVAGARLEGLSRVVGQRARRGERGSGGGPRSQDGSQCSRPARLFAPWQIGNFWTRRPRVPQPGLPQQRQDAESRIGALRFDAQRGGHRDRRRGDGLPGAGPFPAAYHQRRCQFHSTAPGRVVAMRVAGPASDREQPHHPVGDPDAHRSQSPDRAAKAALGDRPRPGGLRPYGISRGDALGRALSHLAGQL